MSERLAEMERRMSRRKAGLDVLINATRLAGGFRRPVAAPRTTAIEDRRYVDFAALDRAVRRARRRRNVGGATALVVGLILLLSGSRYSLSIGYVATALGLVLLVSAYMLTQRLAYEAKRSAFDATGGQPADEVALQDVEQRHHR